MHRDKGVAAHVLIHGSIIRNKRLNTLPRAVGAEFTHDIGRKYLLQSLEITVGLSSGNSAASGYGSHPRPAADASRRCSSGVENAVSDPFCSTIRCCSLGLLAS